MREPSLDDHVLPGVAMTLKLPHGPPLHEREEFASDVRDVRGAYRLRAFQFSSHGQRCAHSAVTIGSAGVAPGGGCTSIKSSISKPLARNRRIQSPWLR